MKLSIRHKLRPFSHRPGTKVVIPGTDRIVQAFPALIRVDGKEIAMEGEGFTVMQDLSRASVIVFSKKKRYEFKGEKKDIEHLFCGVTKKQEWEAICKRRDIRELLPFFYTLSQMAPVEWEKHKGGMFDVKDLLDLMDAGFEGIMTPRLFDTDYLGIVKGTSPDVSAMALFPEVAKRIRSFFIDGTKILPNLLKELHAGKLLNVKLGSLILDIEWSKKMIRRMVILAGGTEEIALSFQSKVKDFRLRCGPLDRGIRIKNGEPISFEKGKRYLLDRFQK